MERRLKVRILMACGAILLLLALLGVLIYGVVHPTPSGQPYDQEKTIFTTIMGVFGFAGIIVCCAGCFTAGDEYKDQPVGTRTGTSERDSAIYMRETVGAADEEAAV